MAAHRARRAAPALASAPWPAAPMGRVYECPGCGERLLGERRCPRCNLFCRALGAGGQCPGCGEPVPVAELVGQGHPDAGARPPRSGALAAGSGPSGGGRGIAEEDAPM